MTASTAALLPAGSSIPATLWPMTGDVLVSVTVWTATRSASVGCSGAAAYGSGCACSEKRAPLSSAATASGSPCSWKVGQDGSVRALPVTLDDRYAA